MVNAYVRLPITQPSPFIKVEETRLVGFNIRQR